MTPHLQNKGYCAPFGSNSGYYHSQEMKAPCAQYEAALRRKLEQEQRNRNKDALEWARREGLIK